MGAAQRNEYKTRMVYTWAVGQGRLIIKMTMKEGNLGDSREGSKMAEETQEGEQPLVPWIRFHGEGYHHVEKYNLLPLGGMESLAQREGDA